MREVRHPSAFSLVELSIVLVILGLLVGGVLTGRSLIRASELRSFTNQMQQFTAATNLFREKYFYLPGDMTNATAFWKKDNATCPGDSGTAGTPGTCNGNGDGLIGDGSYSGPETYRAWQHLAFAGLIQGSYTGVPGGGGTWNSLIGVNVPASKIPSVGYTYVSCPNLGTVCFPSFYYPTQTDTVIEAGLPIPNDATEIAFLTQTEAFNVDTKVDDGKPGTGVYMSWRPSSTGLNNEDCATDNDPKLAVYKTSMNTISCSFNVMQ